MATAQQVLDVARSQIGYQESPPGSNSQKYGPTEPWCVLFVDWVMARADVSLPATTAGVYALRGAFKRAGRLHSTPQAGDVVFYNFGAGHAGIVESVSGASIVTIEGNTGTVSQDSGGEVMRRRRSATALVFGYGRPQYSGSSNPPSADHTTIGTPQTFGDNMTRYPIHIAPLDSNGNGYVTTGIPMEKVVSVLPLGPAPQRDGYGWPNLAHYENNTSGQCEIEVEGGQPGGSIDVVVWAIS